MPIKSLMELFKIDDFYRMSREDQLAVMAEVDPEYYNHPAFLLNSQEFKDSSRDNKYKLINDYMPGFSDMSERDQAGAYKELQNKYNVQRQRNNENYWGKFKNFMSDVAFDFGTKNRQLMSGDIEGALEPQIPEEERQKVIEYSEPIIKGGGAAIGALAATPSGPAGMVAGGGLGYGIAGRAVEAMKQDAGMSQPQSIGNELIDTGADIAEGAMMSAGGGAPVPGIVRRAVGAGVMGAAAGDVREMAEAAQSGQPYEPITMENVGRELGEDIVETGIGAGLSGATELGMGAVSPLYNAGKRVWSRIPKGGVKVKKSAARYAASSLAKMSDRGPVAQANMAEAEALEQQTGARFSLGERSSDIGLIGKQQELVDQYPEAKRMQLANDEANRNAIRGYQDETFGQYSVDDVVSEAEAQHRAYQAQANSATSRLDDLFKNVDSIEPTRTGEILREKLVDKKGAVKATINDLESKIPNADVKLYRADQALGDIEADPKIAPEVKTAVRAYSNKFMQSFQDPENPTLYEGIAASRSLDISIGKSLDQMGRATPMTKALKELKSALHKDLESTLTDAGAVNVISRTSGVDQGTAASAYKKFREYSAKNYFDVYKAGANRDVLAGGHQEGYKRLNEKVPTMYTTPQTAQNLIDGIGMEDAATVMDGHFAYLLNKMGRNGRNEITKNGVDNFLKAYKAPLKKFGLYEKYKNFQNAKGIAEIAELNLKEFEKSTLMDIVGADTDKVAGIIFQGRNRRQNAEEVMDFIKGNAAAEKGMQRVSAEYLIDKLDLEATKFGKPIHIKYNEYLDMMEKNDEALRVIYHNNPEKYDALKAIQNSYKTMSRSSINTNVAPQETDYGPLEKLTGGIAGTRAFQLNAKAATVRDYLRKMRGNLQENIDKLLIRSMFEPDYADVLYKYADGKISRRQLYDRLGRLMNNDAGGGIERRLSVDNQVLKNWFQSDAPTKIGIMSTLQADRDRQERMNQQWVQ